VANPPNAAEVLSTSTLDFSTSGQSMWGSGSAAEYDNTWTLLGFDTGLSSGSIIGDAVGYEFQLAAALQAQLTASTGSISLDYPLNASFNNPNVAAPGQQFTIDTNAAGLNTASPDFSGTLPQITAAIQAKFKGVALVNYDILGSSGSFGVPAFDTTVPLVTVSSGHQITIPPLPDPKKKDNTGGNSSGSNNNSGDSGPGNNSPFKLTFGLPTDYRDANVSVGGQPLPTETLTADTDSIIFGSLDLLQLAAVLIFGPQVQFPSGSIGELDYSIASLALSAGVGLAQQFTFVPTAVMADITAPWGEEEDVRLGQDATFTVPTTWTQSIDLTTKYVLDGDLVSQAGIVGHLDLDLSLLSASLGPVDFGPLFSHTFPLASTDPLYLATSEFALEGFDSVGGSLSIGLGDGLVDLPGGATIDTTDFTANSTAVIQTVLTDAAGGDTTTNIYNPVNKSGSSTAVDGALNIELIAPTSSSYTLPAGFQAGILEPGSGNTTLIGNPDDVLLAAAPGPGETDALVSGGGDTLVGSQEGTVNFIVEPTFTGEIVGLHAGETIELEGVPFDDTGFAEIGANSELVVSENGHTYKIPLHQTEDFTELFFLLSGDTDNTLITIKTRPAPPSDLALKADSDSGVRGDGITNVAEPTIIGFGVAGDTVNLYDGTMLVDITPVGIDGSWNIDLTDPLSEGAHSFTATETDSEGAISNPSPAFAVTIDTTPPAAPTELSLDPDSDSGTQGDNVTDDGTPTINGQGSPGDTITLLEDGTSLGTAIVTNSGDWSVTSSTLSVGKHTLTATDTDAAGNSSGEATPGLTLTITPPPIGPTGENQGFYFGTDGQYVLGTTGNDYIYGNSNGSLIDGLDGNNVIGVTGNNDTINAGLGDDVLSIIGNNGVIDSDGGNDVVLAIGNGDTLLGGIGNNVMSATGTGNLLTGGIGNDTILAVGDHNTIQGGGGTDLLTLDGRGGTVETGFGDSTVFALFGDDTVTGNGNNTIYLGGGNNTLLDASGRHHDTVTGFSAANGDRIHLTTDSVANVLASATQVNFGLDTQITLSDGSTITLKFVSHIDPGFFA
jgi:hypothetical protein